MTELQESRTERAALAVTPHEKAALRFVAARRKTTESDLLRGLLIADIVADYDRALALLDEADEAA